MERKVAGKESSERRATKSWVWARARAEERVPMCKIRFVCKSKELGGGGASGLVRVGGADGIFCPSFGWGGFAEWGRCGIESGYTSYSGALQRYHVALCRVQTHSVLYIQQIQHRAMNMKLVELLFKYTRYTE